MKDDKSNLPIWVEKSHDFQIEDVAKVSIQQSCSNYTSYR